MKNRQVDNRKSKQVRVSAEFHRELKILAAKESVSVKKLLEDHIMPFVRPEEN